MAAVVLAVFLWCGGAQAQTHDWTGFYLGAHGGWGGTTVDYINPGTPEQHLGGALVGAQAGYDFQFDNVVVGAFTDISFMKWNAFERDGNYITEEGEMSHLGSIRAKVGYAVGDFLPYVMAGVAYGDLLQQEQCPSPAAAPFGFCSRNGPFNLDKTHTQWGEVIGAGLQYSIGGGWDVGGSYSHYFMPKTTFRLSPDAKGNPLPDSIVKKRDFGVVRLELNYRF